MKQRCSIATIFTGAATALFMATALAEPLAFKAGEWYGGKNLSDDGGIVSCYGVNGRPENFPRLYILMEADGSTFLSAVDKRWGPWEEGVTVPAKLVINGTAIDSSDALALDERLLGLGVDPELLRGVADGSRIAIETARGRTAVPVYGVAELFVELEKCIKSSPAKDQALTRGAPAAADSRLTVLTCELDNSSQMTVTFDAQNQLVVGRGAVDRVRVTETKISWLEPRGKDDWYFFVIERYSGAISIYVPYYEYKSGFFGMQKKIIEDKRMRLATGKCQVAKNRAF